MSLTSEGQPRLLHLDVLRGFAVLGILLVNAPYFAATWQAAVMPNAIPLTVDETTLWSWLVMHTFFEFKFITLFSMLFGVSLYLVGGDMSDAAKGAQLRRRLAWLLLFGLIHGALIWYGDILATYALTGLLVMSARSMKPGTLLFWGVVITLIPSGIIALGAEAWRHASPEALREQVEAMLLTPQEFAAARAAVTGGFVSAVQQNVAWWTEFFLSSLAFVVPRTAGVMMIGLALFKWGFLTGRAPAWLYALFLALGGVSFALTWMQGLRAFEAGFPVAMVQGEGMLFLTLLSPFGALFYVSLFALVLKSNLFSVITSALAATGRMAFSNYIAQSLIMTGIFWHFGLFGEITRPGLWVLVAAIALAQLIWSPLWLSAFVIGPLEWVWRCLTFQRVVPIRKRPANA